MRHVVRHPGHHRGNPRTRRPDRPPKTTGSTRRTATGLRRHRLQGPQRHRTRNQHRQAMARTGHPVRQTRHRLPRSSRPSSHHTLAQTVRRHALAGIGIPMGGWLGAVDRRSRWQRSYRRSRHRGALWSSQGQSTPFVPCRLVSAPSPTPRATWWAHGPLALRGCDPPGGRGRRGTPDALRGGALRPKESSGRPSSAPPG